MNYNYREHTIPAPCIVDAGTIVNKDDIKRLLGDLGHVKYIHTIDTQICGEGEGWILEIFNDPYQATLIANSNLYLNIQSFDFLKLYKTSENVTYFDLIQDKRQLRLIPISIKSVDQELNKSIDENIIEQIMKEVIASRFDAGFDEENS